MPLRDHFRPPLDNAHSWEELHGGWPMVIVQHLRKRLPPGYEAAPRVHSGSQVEVDVATYQKAAPPSPQTETGDGGVATAVWAPPRPSVAVETTLADYDEYEVRIYDAKRGRLLVAAIEIVSPANKDRPEHRNLFVAKCAALLQKGVAVSVVDLVTLRQFNLYADLLALIGHGDPTLGATPPPLYAASCRWVKKNTRNLLEAWSNPLAVGQPLPTLPLWLSEELVVPLDLEQSYEQACADLWIA
ncbi:MAG: DUF4058 family protein [Planctomycetia bacterium]|nr:DUF4058 family protein [Planctomycetia bacterium]